MSSRTKLWTSALLLVIFLNVLPAHTLTCPDEEYSTGTECCPKCFPGNWVLQDCTEFKPTICPTCREPSFWDVPMCSTCRTCDEGSGLKVKKSCTNKSNTVCEPEDGFYCIAPKGPHCETAQRHRGCRPGQHIRHKGTAQTDTNCSDCTGGTFSDGSLTSCQEHTRCESKNLQEKTPGNSSADAECEEQSSTNTALTVSLVLVSVVGAILGLGIYFIVKKFHKPKAVEEEEAGKRESTVVLMDDPEETSPAWSSEIDRPQGPSSPSCTVLYT
ncbi:tumor necrosis factor receptor superfamily member 14-like isoform X4 [Genypterus blacodes]|uniref:tumor necrosis factor receptor superfamily member 14-like isoform X4 n=1 Tax=Genypterus blacodes TaxID=154954 RepID=UPI003F768B97